MENIDQLFQEGLSALNNKEFPKAEENFKQIVDLNSTYAEAYHNLGIALVSQGKYEEAMEKYKKAIELKPVLADSYYGLANALLAKGKYLEAIENYKKTVEIYNSDNNLLNSAIVYRNWGLALYNLKDYNNSIVKYQNAIDIKPDYADVFTDIGNALFALGKYPEAIDNYKKALDIYDRDKNVDGSAIVNRNLGLALYNIKDYENSIVKYIKAIEIKPDYADAFTDFGNALFALGKYPEAIDNYKKALDIYDRDKNVDGSAIVNRNLGLALFNLKKYENSIEKCQKAIKLKPDYADAFNDMGNIFFEQGKYPEAIEKYQKVILLKPDYIYALNNLGKTYVEIKDYYLAIKSYSDAIEINKDFVYAYHNLAECYEKIGDYKKSNEYWKIIRKLYADSILKHNYSYDPDYYYHYYYGSVLSEIFGELNEATDVLELGLNITPKEQYEIKLGFLFYLIDIFKEKAGIAGALKIQKYFKQAEKILKDRILKSNDSEEKFYYYRFLSVFYLKIDDFYHAQKYLEEAAKHMGDTESPLLCSYFAYCYYAQNQYAKAEDKYREAHLLLPDDYDIWSNLAEIYLKQNNTDQAEKEYLKILREIPGNIDSLIGLGELYTKLGDDGDLESYVLAEEKFSETIKRVENRTGSKRLSKEDLSDIYYQRGYVRIKQCEGKSDLTCFYGALNDFKRSKQLNSIDPKAIKAIRKLQKFKQSMVTDKITLVSQYIILTLAILMFIWIQLAYFGSGLLKATWNISIPQSFNSANYIFITSVSLIFMIAAPFLPSITKLKVGTVTFEKTPIEQITLTNITNLSKSSHAFKPKFGVPQQSKV